MAHIVLINPRFDPSFWGMEHFLPLVGKKANMPVAALPLIAALTPAGHTITLLDENVEDIDYDEVARADIVGITGMCVQRVRMRAILTELKERGCYTVVGGPWVTVSEDYFSDLADTIFVGEAEETWPMFLKDWQEGRPAPRYEQDQKTDLSRVPVPRCDLLKMNRYLFGSVQFSRGCPFQCEFCDIIVTFGRRPRLKTSSQILAEIDALRAQGVVSIFIVDDNLIGNKKAIKCLLRDLVDYQKANGYPVDFVTEASLDLAEDQELMDLMVEAHICSVFVGIESPNADALRETKKFQNVRPVGTIVERVHRIQAAGLEVWCGMIVGFDHDDASVFDAQLEFLKEARIGMVMVNMLTAIPKTPLYARLEAEGRLDPSDDPEYGTNVIPLRMTRAELRDGFVRMMTALYEPEAYLARLEDLFLRGRLPQGQGAARHLRRRPLRWLAVQLRGAILTFALLFLVRNIPGVGLAQEYRRRVWRLFLARLSPNLVVSYTLRVVLHYHFHRLAKQTAAGERFLINTF